MRKLVLLPLFLLFFGCVTEPEGDLTAEQQLELNRQRIEQQRINQESAAQALEAAERALEVYDEVKQQQCRDGYWEAVQRAVDACEPLPPWPCLGDGPDVIGYEC